MDVARSHSKFALLLIPLDGRGASNLCVWEVDPCAGKACAVKRGMYRVHSHMQLFSLLITFHIALISVFAYSLHSNET